MKSPKNTKEELHNLAPELAKLKRHHPNDGFQVPPRYFRELEAAVLDRIASQHSAAVPAWRMVWHWVMMPPRPVFALATLLLLALSVWWMVPQGNETTFFANTSDIALEELEIYVSSNLDDFSPEMILDISHEQTDFVWELTLEDLSEDELDNLLEEFIDDIDQQTLEQIL